MLLLIYSWLTGNLLAKEIDGGADDKPVRRLKLSRQIVDLIVKCAFPCFAAALTGDTAAYDLPPDEDVFVLHAVLFKYLFRLTECKSYIAARTRASVYHQNSELIHIRTSL